MKQILCTVYFYFKLKNYIVTFLETIYLLFIAANFTQELHTAILFITWKTKWKLSEHILPRWSDLFWNYFIFLNLKRHSSCPSVWWVLNSGFALVPSVPFSTDIQMTKHDNTENTRYLTDTDRYLTYRYGLLLDI